MNIPQTFIFDERDNGYNPINYIHIAKQLIPLLSKIAIQKFPIPLEVKELVDNAVINVFSVLIKHNLLTKQALNIIKEYEIHPKIIISDGIIRVWKTAQKLRSWLMQKYQAAYSTAQQELQRKKKRTRI